MSFLQLRSFLRYAQQQSTSLIKTFLGLARASTKTVNGVALSSVKNKNGLA